MFHTRYFGSDQEATANFSAMKQGLAEILLKIPLASDPNADARMSEVGTAIGQFVEHYP